MKKTTIKNHELCYFILISPAKKSPKIASRDLDLNLNGGWILNLGWYYWNLILGLGFNNWTRWGRLINHRGIIGLIGRNRRSLNIVTNALHPILVKITGHSWNIRIGLKCIKCCNVEFKVPPKSILPIKPLWLKSLPQLFKPKIYIYQPCSSNPRPPVQVQVAKSGDFWAGEIRIK